MKSMIIVAVLASLAVASAKPFLGELGAGLGEVGADLGAGLGNIGAGLGVGIGEIGAGLGLGRLGGYDGGLGGIGLGGRGGLGLGFL
ncbi:acanthoscurrin-1-like [Spodoptera litura]|uniref:Acanthoscurrin-1-like n=1 Tax=Spodoptera litura TaxID=69820 RepID=A0A9J7EPL0_SPOLT|nr:acanthoscurrin-1-like [Spodoptera litura]